MIRIIRAKNERNFMQISPYLGNAI